MTALSSIYYGQCLFLMHLTPTLAVCQPMPACPGQQKSLSKTLGDGVVQIPESWHNGLKSKVGFGCQPLLAFPTPFSPRHPGSSYMPLASQCPTWWQASRPAYPSKWPLPHLPLCRQKLIDNMDMLDFEPPGYQIKQYVHQLRASWKVRYSHIQHRMQWISSFTW